MDALSLLNHARAAGLRIEVVDSTLKIQGPRSAEHVVKLLAEHKSAVLAALVPIGQQQEWRERFTAWTFRWSCERRPWEEARRLAWGDLQNQWHFLHGQRWPSWQCAGCHQPIDGLAALNLADGNRVHFDNIDCLITFGRRWRGVADQQLAAFGLEPPAAGDGFLP